jgi:hypothetical protein
MKSEKKARSKNAKQPRDSTPVPSARARTHPRTHKTSEKTKRERERERERERREDRWMKKRMDDKREKEGRIDECQIHFIFFILVHYDIAPLAFSSHIKTLT